MHRTEDSDLRFRHIPHNGEQDAAPLIALVDNVVEVLGAGRQDRLEAKVVEDQELWLQVRVQAAGVGAIGATAVEMQEHLVCAGKQHIVAAAAGFVPQRLREV